MFKVECNKGNINLLEVRGNVAEILADLCIIVKHVNSCIDDDAKGYFENAFKSGMFADLAFASDKEINAKLEEQKAKTDELKSMIKKLEALAEAIKNL